MVNLPDHEGVFDEPALTPTGIRDARRCIQQREEELRQAERNRLQATRVSWGQDINGMYGDIELVDNNGTIIKTQRFPIPAGVDMRSPISYAQMGNEVRLIFENGTEFRVNIQSIENPPPGYNAWDMDHDAVLEARATALHEAQRRGYATTPLTQEEAQRRYYGAQGLVLDEAVTFGTNAISSCKKKKTIKLPKNMKCTFCNEHIHYPERLVELLTEKGAKDYLKYCKKSKTKPQLFCCECYDFIKRNPKIYGALNKLDKQLEKFVKINEKEKELKVREKELDKQLNKMRKKKPINKGIPKGTYETNEKDGG